MRRSLVDLLILLTLLGFGAVAFLPGINWGLPSREVDKYLFGSREPWSAREILELAPVTASATLAADVDANPLAARDKPVVLNETDAQRAEIVRRYRLFSFQPDEMITFDALAGMNPAKLRLDPKLYQYGGLWIYPVGALIKLALNPTSDVSYYLDHPEAFGRFYVVARMYSAAWGLVGILAVYWIVRRATGCRLAGIAAAACFVCLPVVVNMAHEAKPHLPGAVLMLLAIMAATKFAETGATRWWLGVSILCGAAAGMVLSAAVIIVIIPLITLLRRETWGRRASVTALGLAVVMFVYVMTNPYVAINLVTNRDVLRSNFANTAAMYEAGRLGEGVINALALIREGTSLGVMIAGLTGVVVLIVLAIRARRVHPIAWLIGVPALVITVQFIALAAGKPGEYGRFALLPDIALALAAACAIRMVAPRRIVHVVAFALLVALAAFPSSYYLRGFISDASKHARRLDDAYWLSLLQQAGATTLAVYQEPAPYSLPPVNLFEWKLVLLPRDFDIRSDPTDADVIVRPVDDPEHNGAPAGPFVLESTVTGGDVFPARISWAGKPFEVWVRPALIERVR